MSETLDQKLTALKLQSIRQVYSSWTEQAVQSELGYAEFLERLKGTARAEEMHCGAR